MYCILIAGMPASGKTTFAKYLSKELGIPMVSKDELKEKLYDTIGFHSRAEKVALGVGAMECMYYMAESMMRIHKPIILENNFENSSKDGLEQLLHNYKYTPITVRFQGDIEAIYTRFIARDQSPERHRGHVVNTQYPEPTLAVGEERPPYVPMGLEQFERIFTERGIKDFAIGNNVICVDSTELPRVNYEDIVNKIKNLTK